MSRIHKPLDEQVILITGASSGIGLCTAFLAAERGARLVLVARSEGTLEELANQINNSGGEAIYIAADVAEREKLADAADEAISYFGRIDTWINNAGVSIYGRLEEVSEEDCRRLFDTNFWGVVNGSLIALPYLRQQGGALVNVGSEVSDAVLPLQGIYSASKHAVKGFTDALRIEVENIDKSSVSITLIQPTAVNTPLPRHARNYMDKAPKVPSPMIDPQQVAEAILKAATDGGRDVRVGSMAFLETAMAKIMPELTDRMSALQAGRQQEDYPAIHQDGGLYRPVDTGRIYGQTPT